MHAISSYRGNRPTNTPTNRTDYNTLCRSFASAQCNYAKCRVSDIVLGDTNDFAPGCMYIPCKNAAILVVLPLVVSM